jgi:hypothetical protein
LAPGPAAVEATSSFFPGSGGWPSEAILPPPSSIRLATRRNGWNRLRLRAARGGKGHGKPEASGRDGGLSDSLTWDGSSPAHTAFVENGEAAGWRRQVFDGLWIGSSLVLFGDHCSIIAWSSIFFFSSNFKFRPCLVLKNFWISLL